MQGAWHSSFGERKTLTQQSACLDNPHANILKLTFPYNEEAIPRVKEIPGRQFIKSGKCWLFPPSLNSIATVKQLFPSVTLTESVAALEKLFHVEQSRIQAVFLERSGFPAPDADRSVIKAYKDRIRKLLIRDFGWRDDDKTGFIRNIDLYPNQLYGLLHLLSSREHALLWQPGCMKTMALVAAMAYRLYKRQARRILIICPLAVNRVWREAIHAHSRLRYSVIAGDPDDRRSALSADAPIDIIHYDALRIHEDDLIKRQYDMVVCDESQRIKTASAQRSQAAYKLGAVASFRAIASGTAISQSQADIFGQYKFLDCGATFGTLIGAFRERYFHKLPGLSFDKYVFLERKQTEFTNLIYAKATRFLLRECADLPEVVTQPYEVNLTADQWKVYKTLKRELVIRFTEGTVSAKNILTEIVKLNQIASGFVMTQEGKTVELPSNAKLAAIDEICEDHITNDNKLVIWCYFRWDIERLMRHLTKYRPVCAYGATRGAGTDASIDSFKTDPNCKIMIANPQSIGLGQNFAAVSNTCCFYSRDYSLDNYEQGWRRLLRVPQNRTVLVINMIATGTIDENIARSHERNQDASDEVLNNWPRILK